MVAWGRIERHRFQNHHLKTKTHIPFHFSIYSINKNKAVEFFWAYHGHRTRREVSKQYELIYYALRFWQNKLKNTLLLVESAGV